MSEEGVRVRELVRGEGRQGSVRVLGNVPPSLRPRVWQRWANLHQPVPDERHQLHFAETNPDKAQRTVW